MTYIKREIDGNNVAGSKKLVERDISCVAFQMWFKAVAVMVLHLHVECQCTPHDCSANSSHAKNTEDLALRVVSEANAITPLTPSKKSHAPVEASKGTENEEHVDVGGGIVNSSGYVGHTDATVSARLDINLVVASACTVVSILQG